MAGESWDVGASAPGGVTVSDTGTGPTVRDHRGFDDNSTLDDPVGVIADPVPAVDPRLTTTVADVIADKAGDVFSGDIGHQMVAQTFHPDNFGPAIGDVFNGDIGRQILDNVFQDFGSAAASVFDGDFGRQMTEDIWGNLPEAVHDAVHGDTGRELGESVFDPSTLSDHIKVALGGDLGGELRDLVGVLTSPSTSSMRSAATSASGSSARCWAARE